MKQVQLLILILLTACISVAQQPSTDSARLQSDLKLTAQKMGQFFIEKDFIQYSEFVYPKLIELNGGQEKYIDIIKNSMNKIEEQGFTFKNISFGDPSKIVTTSTEFQTVIPQILELKNKSGLLATTSYLICISNKEGKTWHFIDTGGKTLEQLQKVIPTLSNELLLPPNKAPVFTKTK